MCDKGWSSSPLPLPARGPTKRPAIVLSISEPLSKQTPIERGSLLPAAWMSPTLAWISSQRALWGQKRPFLDDYPGHRDSTDMLAISATLMQWCLVCVHDHMLGKGHSLWGIITTTVYVWVYVRMSVYKCAWEYVSVCECVLRNTGSKGRPMRRNQFPCSIVQWGCCCQESFSVHSDAKRKGLSIPSTTKCPVWDDRNSNLLVLITGLHRCQSVTLCPETCTVIMWVCWLLLCQVDIN